jgi:uncharacterized protein YyaL (SSP411 family)
MTRSIFTLITLTLAVTIALTILWHRDFQGGGLMPNETAVDNSTGRTNRLINEKSPYLLQHSTNPVDWYPWGNEAFEKARTEDKPIFLSIGYSTCHWCHVMEHESFEDDSVAGLMNDAFVSIKVDREERPDIDNIYMTVCQIVTGSGGWPLTIIMTPDKKPFFAATYIPRESRFGQIGLTELVPRIKELWKSRRADILQSADQITEALAQASNGTSHGELSEPILKAAFEHFQQSFDSRFGGFGRAPKFPTPHNLLFLLRYWKRYDDPQALDMAEKTLRAMRLGGIYDHIGFGFHRYSTDPQWLLPHFEKMLYDQALLAIAYVEAFSATGKGEYRQTASEIFEYVLRDMTDSSGAFFSAEDADSEGEEGKFYLWTEDEVMRLLGPIDADLFSRIYDIQEDGNFDEQATGRKNGMNIVHLNKSISALSREMNLPESDLNEKLKSIRERLLEYRNLRPRPHKDDKILTDWNGLMIASLALGAQVLDKPIYADAATKAVDFIFGNMRTSEGRLLHRYRDDQAAVPGSIDDYSFLIWGLLNLYEATFETRFLKDALELNEVALERFWDEESGAFHFTADDAEKLPVRTKEVYDGALPSGNSVAAYNLIRLGRISGNPEFEARAEKIVNGSSGQVRRAPQAFTMLLSAFDFALGPGCEVVVVGKPDAADTQEMIRVIRQHYIPNKVVIFRPDGPKLPDIVHFAGFVKDQKSIDGKATAYVCRRYTCDLPTTDIATMLQQLQDDRTDKQH